MLVKVPPFIMKPEELGENDMIWCSLFAKWSRIIDKKQIILKAVYKGSE